MEKMTATAGHMDDRYLRRSNVWILDTAEIIVASRDDTLTPESETGPFRSQL